MAALSDLTGLINLIQGVQGGKQTTTSSGGTQTSQTQLSDAAVQEQIKRILAGPGGVRDIGSSARKSGLYNNTSEDILLGNLYATAANQGEIARAPTVTTTTPQTQTTTSPGIGLGNIAGAIGGAVALNSILNSSTAKNFGNSVLDTIGLGGGSTGAPVLGDGSVDFGLSGLLSGGQGIGATGTFTEGDGGGPVFAGDAFSSQLGQSLPGISSGTTSGASGAYNPNDDFDLVGSVGNAISGFFSGGGLGGLVGAITGGTGGGGGGGGTSGGSIICTALIHHGLLNPDHYALGEAYIAKVPMEVKVGYYAWAAPIAKKIRAGNTRWTKVCLPFARSRTALLTTDGTFVDHIKHPLGTITKFIGEPLCGVYGRYILSKVLAGKVA
jgi:hypothetical protein